MSIPPIFWRISGFSLWAKFSLSNHVGSTPRINQAIPVRVVLHAILEPKVEHGHLVENQVIIKNSEKNNGSELITETEPLAASPGL